MEIDEKEKAKKIMPFSFIDGMYRLSQNLFEKSHKFDDIVRNALLVVCLKYEHGFLT